MPLRQSQGQSGSLMVNCSEEKIDLDFLVDNNRSVLITAACRVWRWNVKQRDGRESGSVGRNRRDWNKSPFFFFQKAGR